MGRVLRSRSRLENANCENLSSKTFIQKPNVKVTGSSQNKRVKSALSDRTNLNLQSEKGVKCDTEENHKVRCNRKNPKGLKLIDTSNSSEISTSIKNKRNTAVASRCNSPATIETSKKGIVELKVVKTRSNFQSCRTSKKEDNSFLGSKGEGSSSSDKSNVDEPFLGFKNPKKSPLLDVLRKYLDNVSQLSKDSKKGYLPVYRLNKPSPPKMDTSSAEDRLHLYDFEIDENEPPIKKGKRKPILKFKKYRTYNRKKKDFLPSFTPIKIPTSLKSSNQVNVCSSGQIRNKLQNGYTPLSPIPETRNESFLDHSVGNDMDTSIESHISNRPGVYSPPPYQSPKRDSLNVPILRTSTSVNDETSCSRNLNKSINSSKHDISVNSGFSANFNTPVYIGSSTPIHRHWADQSNVYCNMTSRNYNFDESNYFGFNDDNVEEPIVSPIKRYETPVKLITPKKPSPVKIPHRQVIRMLKFGADIPDTVPDDDDESLPIDKILPANFFHEGDTPEFSPPSTPETPVVIKKNRKINRAKTVKKQVAFVEENLEDSDFATQSSEDKTSLDESIMSNDQTSRRITRSKQPLSKSIKCHQTSKKKTKTYDSDIEKDNGYETEISPNKETTFTDCKKHSRRSYERPVYLRQKKYEEYDVVGSDDEEVEEIMKEANDVVKEKPQRKKKNALSKKEQMELEKWARAFNEQCMQVENFDLVVE